MFGCNYCYFFVFLFNPHLIESLVFIVNILKSQIIFYSKIILFVERQEMINLVMKKSIIVIYIFFF